MERTGECFFVSDLHGNIDRYDKLFRAIETFYPTAVFLGGDLLPSHLISSRSSYGEDFINGYLIEKLMSLKSHLAARYPRIFIILGNDDVRHEESAMLAGAAAGIWEYVHDRQVDFDDYTVIGYSYVPPTPFRLKDWERYDVSRYTDPGCLSPEEGVHSVSISEYDLKYATIADDLQRLSTGVRMEKAIFLFHAPPYQTKLDRTALDGKSIDHVPLDIHTGSIAVKRFIEGKQPWLTLHGHIHESARLTGFWLDKIGRTHLFSAAHDGPELALIRFKADRLYAAVRELI